MLHFIALAGADLMKRYNKYLASPPPIEIISAAEIISQYELLNWKLMT